MQPSSEELIERFYTSFKNRDPEGMTAYYVDDAIFRDSAFGSLAGEEVRNMWRMLIELGGESLHISYRIIEANDSTGIAAWTADYLFPQTGRKIRNEVVAHFEFREGKIVRHIDTFSFWKWSQQAFGPVGFVLGWTPLMRWICQRQSRKQLAEFSRKRADRAST